MRISDWSSDVCSSDLGVVEGAVPRLVVAEGLGDAVGDRLGVTGDQVVALAGENLVATGGVVLPAVHLVRGLRLGVLVGDRLGVAGDDVVAPAREDLVVAGLFVLAAAGRVVRLRLCAGVHYRAVALGVGLG